MLISLAYTEWGAPILVDSYLPASPAHTVHEPRDDRVSLAVRGARGVSYLFLSSFLSNIFSLMYLIFAARVLSTEEVGVVSALTMVSTLFLTIGAFALPQTATRFVAQLKGGGDMAKVRGVEKKILISGFVASLFVSLICLSLSGPISSAFLGSAEHKLPVMVLAIDLFAVLFREFPSGVLMGFQKWREIAWVNIASGAVRGCIAIIFLTFGWGATGVVAGWSVGNYLAVVLLLAFALPSVKGEVEDIALSVLARFSFPLYIAAIVEYLQNYIDRYLILGLSNFSTLGIYTMALAASNVENRLLLYIGSSLLPLLSELYGGHGNEAIRNASKHASRYVALLYLPIGVGAASVAGPLIVLFAGPRYVDGAIALAVLSIANAATCLWAITDPIIMSLGRTKIIFERSLCGMIVNIAVFMWLTPVLGLLGAALGRAALITTSFVYSALALKKLGELHFDAKIFYRAMVAAIVMGITVITTISLWEAPSLLAFYVTIGVLIYLAMLKWLKLVNASDLDLLKHIFPEKLGWLIASFSKLLVT